MRYFLFLIFSLITISISASQECLPNPFVLIGSEKNIEVNKIPYEINFLSEKTIKGPGVYEVTYWIKTGDSLDTISAELYINGTRIEDSKSEYAIGDTICGFKKPFHFYTYADINDVTLKINSCSTNKILEASVSILRFSY